MNGDNPCNICVHLDDCEGCIFYRMAWRSKGECNNDKCMNWYECGCLLSLDSYCKASTAFNQWVYVMETDPDDEEVE